MLNLLGQKAAAVLQLQDSRRLGGGAARSRKAGGVGETMNSIGSRYAPPFSNRDSRFH